MGFVYADNPACESEELCNRTTNDSRLFLAFLCVFMRFKLKIGPVLSKRSSPFLLHSFLVSQGAVTAVCSEYGPFSFQRGTFPVILLEINKLRSKPENEDAAIR